jgi:hypothetical protein
MIRYHMGAPPNSDTYENSKGTANIGAVLTAGSAENRSFLSKLDYVAAELQKLEDAEVAVLWRPFHEYQPNGWFWWSKGSADQFKQLWRTMYEYLTSTKGLDNLVWLAPSSGTVDAAWYPGQGPARPGGGRTRTTPPPPFSGMYSAAKAVIGSTVPIPLHETGTVPQPSTMFPTAAPWVLWNIWAGYQSDGTHNSVATVRTAIESPYTINRDELPDLRLSRFWPRCAPSPGFHPRPLRRRPRKLRAVGRSGAPPRPTARAARAAAAPQVERPLPVARAAPRACGRRRRRRRSRGRGRVDGAPAAALADGSRGRARARARRRGAPTRTAGCARADVDLDPRPGGPRALPRGAR